MSSIENSVFTDMVVKTPNKSVFDLSHSHKTTLKFGDLVPIMIQECLPNDTFRIRTDQMVRLVPLATPVMHDIDVFVHHFFVPNRILWKNWENFIRGPRSRNDDWLFSMPVLDANTTGAWTTNGVPVSSLANYLGLPAGFRTLLDSNENFEISAFPFAVYQKIWYDYYRDENLQFPLDPMFDDPFLQDGAQPPDDMTAALITMRKRAWEHDYFTSALPFAQKGEPVPIPVIGSGGVEFDLDAVQAGAFGQWLKNNGDGAAGDNFRANVVGGGTLINETGTGSGDVYVNYDPSGTLKAIINNVATTIKDLRTAEALQKFLEKNARAGNRYFEYLRAVFGQKSPDSRLQRAEYIGGAKHQFNISEVLQTSETTPDSPQGQMSGHSISVGSSAESTYHCEEHGFIMSIMSVRPRTSYAQGLHRMWRRFDRFDFALPDFAHIGEQEVRNYELFFSKSLTDNQLNATFGYMPRYAEYKVCNSRTSGEFLTTYAPWVMPRLFTALPTLESDFIECDPKNEIFPIDLDDMGDYILADTYFSITKSSTLPRFDIPQLT